MSPPGLRHRLPAVSSRSPSRVLTPGPLGALGGCATLLGRAKAVIRPITPYRVDIVQGDSVSPRTGGALKPGMTRVQVREILGTPLVASPFHADRWDYIFTLGVRA